MPQMLLPEDFEAHCRTILGPSRYNRLVTALGEEPPISIRLNPDKQKDVTALHDRVPWCAEGFYMPSRPAFTFDPLLHAGVYYVQEASSMFISEVLRQLVQDPVAMLDLCAAPGGKSTAALSVLPQGSLVMSNEPVGTRASVLTENIQKWGLPHAIVTRNYPQDYAKSGLLFDVILTDVPCSGEGMFRKDPVAIQEWSARHVDECAALQRDIVEQAWKCLRPGGLLVYSTCTFNIHENEENISWICNRLGAEPQPVHIPQEWGIASALVVPSPIETDHSIFRFFPGETRGEGLFMAVLRKPGNGIGVLRQNTEKTRRTDKKNRLPNLQKTSRPKTAVDGVEELRTQLYDHESYVIRTDAGICRAIPSTWSSIYDKAVDKLHVLHAGVPLGNVKTHGILPSPALALSTALLPDAFPRVELNYREALSYLRREAVMLPGDAPRGYIIVCYQGYPLGFEKNMGNRANNVYPMEWRIKSSHLPDQPLNIIQHDPVSHRLS